MANLNGHETGNGGYSQGESYGNSPFFDPTDEGELEIEPLATTPVLYSTGAHIIPQQVKSFVYRNCKCN